MGLVGTKVRAELEAVAYSLVGCAVRDDDAAFRTLTSELCRSDLIKLLDACVHIGARQLTALGLPSEIVTTTLQEKAIQAKLSDADGRT